MDNFPAQLMLYGFISMLLEPFTFGFAGFVLSYRFSRHLMIKIVVVAITVLLFLLIDEVWPAWANQSSGIGVAISNEEFNELLAGEQTIGEAQFDSGEESGLYAIFNLSTMDYATSISSVLAAYHIGLVLTRRKWLEAKRKGAE